MNSFDSEWVPSVNTHLPNHIRLHHVYHMPKVGDFHAETSCSQRVYEYMLPMSTLFDYCDWSSDAATSMIHRMQENGINLVEQLTYMNEKFCVINDADLEGKRGRTNRNGDWETKRPRNRMDQMFPDEDTEYSRKRIAYFRNLKVLFKKFGGNHAFHNFAAGGGSPDETVTHRKVDRMYHKEVVEILASSSSSDISPVTAVGSKRPDHPVRRGSDYRFLWAVFSASGDSFLRGQVLTS